jgi:hypothetical protein
MLNNALKTFKNLKKLLSISVKTTIRIACNVKRILLDMQKIFESFQTFTTSFIKDIK